MAVFSWSKTAASNATADSTINWAEGMAPAAVNDSSRAEMAAVKKWVDDISGTLTTAGTATAYTLATNSVFTSATVMSGAKITFIPHVTSGAAPTLAVDGLTAYALNSASGVAVPNGYFKIGTPYSVTYISATTEFIVQNVPAVLPASLVTTTAIADSAVTYAKVQNLADQKLLGNISGLPAAPAEITIGAGLTATGSTIKSAFPPPSAFKNLSIKVASNTTVAVAADFVTTTNGTTYQTTPLSVTVNLGTTGAGALDTGTIAINTWYAIWAIAKADGTTSAIASASYTAPTMPIGYTYKAYIGSVQTVNATATLYGTWQFGRRAQYVVGLAQTTALPVIGSGASGSTSVPTWTALPLARFAPTTASEVIGLAVIATTGGGGSVNLIAAPNSSYGASSNTTNPAPVDIHALDMGTYGTISQAQFSMLIESANIYYASGNGLGRINAQGWVDNI